MTKLSSSDLIPFPHQFALALCKNLGREMHLEVRGNSMQPLISVGDLIIVQPMAAASLKLGDILVFQEGENIVAHRFVRIAKLDNQRWVCQKGDNTFEWGWIPEDRVLGRVKTVRSSTRFLNMHHRPWTWLNRCMALLALSWILVQKKNTSQSGNNSGWYFLAIILKINRRILSLMIKALRMDSP